MYDKLCMYVSCIWTVECVIKVCYVYIHIHMYVVGKNSYRISRSVPYSLDKEIFRQSSRSLGMTHTVSKRKLKFTLQRGAQNFRSYKVHRYQVAYSELCIVHSIMFGKGEVRKV
jgi:hypothetical protein